MPKKIIISMAIVLLALAQHGCASNPTGSVGTTPEFQGSYPVLNFPEPQLSLPSWNPWWNDPQ